MNLPSFEQEAVMYTFGRYDERTGRYSRIAVNPYMLTPFSLKPQIDMRYFTRKGRPRKSIVVKGKRYYREGQ